MDYQHYTIEETEQGYRITTPEGRALAMPACSLEAAKIRADCHREQRMPTEEEKRVLHPFLYAPITYPRPRKRRATAVVFGSRVFVRR
jgi:hypothetical protein